jgi:O-antigen/teichoic acid export membrane protein
MLTSFKAGAIRLFNRLFQNALIRRVVKNTGYLFSATGVAAFMGMLQGILSARLLEPALFGVLGAVTSFTSTVNRFASFRMNELVVRYVGHYQENGDALRAAGVFKLASLLESGGTLFAFALTWLLAGWGARFFAHDSSLITLFRLYGGVVVLANLTFESSSGLLQIFDRFRLIAILTMAQSAFTLFLIALVFVFRGGLNMLVLAYMLGKSLGSLVLIAAAWRQARTAWGGGWWRTSLKPLSGEMRSLITFAFSTNLSSTISLIAKDSEVLWVSAFLGTTQAGYYKLALALANVLQLPVSPLPKATYPELSREVARSNWENVRNILRQGSRLSAVYSIPTTLGLILLGRWVIALVYRPAYLPAYPALVILLIGYTIVNILYWNRVALLALSRPVFPTLVNFIGMVFKVAAIFLLVPAGGYLVFAWLLTGYYLFTVGIAAARVLLDLRERVVVPAVG